MVGIDTRPAAGGHLRIMGVGGAGIKVVDRLLRTGRYSTETWVCSTVGTTGIVGCRNRLQIGRTLTRGLGAGGDPEIGRLAAEEDLDPIRKALEGAEALLVTAGLGGGVGSGATPVILREARALGILTVAIVTMPFLFEGRHRMSRAQAALETLRGAADTLILLPHDQLLDKRRDVPLHKAFDAADETLSTILSSISALISGQGLINVNFADLRSVLTNRGVAKLGLGVGRGPNGHNEAARLALACRSLDGVSLTSASQLLLHVRGSVSMSLSEVAEIGAAVSEAVGADVDVFLGCSIDDVLVDEVQVTLIATGLPESSTKEEAVWIRDSAVWTGALPDPLMVELHMDRRADTPEDEVPLLPLPAAAADEILLLPPPSAPADEILLLPPPAAPRDEALPPPPAAPGVGRRRPARPSHPSDAGRRMEERRNPRLSEPANVPPGVAGPPVIPSDGSPKPSPPALGDPVDCTVFAPPKARPGQTILIQVFAHLVEAARKAESLAILFDETTGKRGFTSLRADVSRGSTLTFHLTSVGAQIDEPVQTIVWRGRTIPVDFSLSVPETNSVDRLIAKLIVSQDSVPLGQITFTIGILDLSQRVKDDEPVPVGTARQYQHVFVSYASEDRTEVLKRVQMLRSLGIGYFHDSLSIRTGETWERKILQNVALADLFLLFWSQAARSSEWVRKEIRLALDRKAGVDENPPEIMPVILEGPPIPEPPEELRHIQFNDNLVYFMNR